jgi:post-segregation antitoxin (ccd killing protein)
MTRQNARVKSVHFNVTVEDDLKMLKAIGKRNFSRYVKQLIKADIERKKELPQQPIKQSGGIKFVLE